MSYVTDRHMGFIPVLAAGVAAAGSLLVAGKQSKDAKEQADAAERAAQMQLRIARQAKKAETASSRKWVWIAGAAALVGIGAIILMRSRKKGQR